MNEIEREKLQKQLKIACELEAKKLEEMLLESKRNQLTTFIGTFDSLREIKSRDVNKSERYFAILRKENGGHMSVYHIPGSGWATERQRELNFIEKLEKLIKEHKEVW